MREATEETLLCGMAGYADAVGYILLGSIFAANMTGNTVLLAIAVTQGATDAILGHGAAIAGFFAGALVGRSLALVAPTRAPELLLQAALLGLLVAVSLPTFAKLALLALAMGIQASARVQVGAPSREGDRVPRGGSALCPRLDGLWAWRRGLAPWPCA